MNLQSTSAGIKVSVFDANSTGDMYDMIFRNIRIIDTNRGLCIAPRWGSNIISNLLFDQINIETRFFGLDWWGSGEGIYITGLSANSDHQWTGKLKNITIKNVITEGEQGFIIRGNTSLLENISMKNISLLIDRWSNVSEHPSKEPQMAWAKVDGIFAMDISGLHLENIDIQFKQPRQYYYGECLNFSNISQMIKTNIQCRNNVLLSSSKKIEIQVFFLLLVLLHILQNLEM